MGDRTGISWTRSYNPDGTYSEGATWNIVSGCTKLSPECKFCYVDRDWHRLIHLPAYAGRDFTDIACHPERLDQPLRWQRPRRIFVCSTSDLFHEAVPDAFLDQAFGVMSLCPQHTFLILTKRAKRMRQYLAAPGRREAIAKAAAQFQARHPLDWVRADGSEAGERGGDPDENSAWIPRWPLPNVQVGVTAGTEGSVNEHIGHLVLTPAAKRWISMEPLLEAVDLSSIPWPEGYPVPADDIGDGFDALRHETLHVDGIVVGGESGPGARPMHPRWARDLRDQCQQAKVPFFFKQHGEWTAIDPLDWDGKSQLLFLHADSQSYVPDGQRLPKMLLDDQDSAWACMARLGRNKTGDRLDGREHRELP